jgi:hypothetical protein
MKKPRDVEREEKRRFWEERLQDWKESELCQSEFCRRNDLKVCQFMYWKKRILRQPSLPVALVELPVPRSALLSLGSPIGLTISNKYRIEIDKGFDPETLHQVLRVLDRL